MNASTSFPVFIYSLRAIFFSLYLCRGFSPFRGRYSSPGVKNFTEELKKHFCTPLPSCKYPIEKIILTHRNKNRLRLVFQLLLSFLCEAKIPSPFFSQAHLHKVLWRLPVQKCFDCWSLASRCYSGIGLRYLLHIATTLYNCDEKHIKTALGVICFRTP